MNAPGPQQEILIAAMCIGGAIGLMIGLTIYTFFVLTLTRALKEIEERNREIAPGTVWLTLLLLFIPVVSAIWLIYLVNKMAGSVRREYEARGLVVLGCPCNQFGNQEPGDAAEIASFCESRFGVSFPLSAKLEVKGSGADPLFRHLCAAAPGVLGTQVIKWNFTKFLVGRDGRAVERYAPTTPPAELRSRIEALLES